MQTAISEIGPGGSKAGRFGHGLGLQLTERPSHAARDTTKITENMVLTIAPSLSHGDGRVMVDDECILVRTDGPELLTTRAAPDLPVIER